MSGSVHRGQQRHKELLLSNLEKYKANDRIKTIEAQIHVKNTKKKRITSTVELVAATISEFSSFIHNLKEQKKEG